jgi:hypothetical protein
MDQIENCQIPNKKNHNLQGLTKMMSFKIL